MPKTETQTETKTETETEAEAEAEAETVRTHRGVGVCEAFACSRHRTDVCVARVVEAPVAAPFNAYDCKDYGCKECV